MQFGRWLSTAYKRTSTYWAIWALFVLSIATKSTSTTHDINIRILAVLLSLFLMVGLPKLIINMLKSFGRFVIGKSPDPQRAKNSAGPRKSALFYATYIPMALTYAYFSISGGLILIRSITIRSATGKELSDSELNKGGIYLALATTLFIILIIMRRRSNRPRKDAS